MVNSTLCETARLAVFSVSPRLFDFLNYETENQDSEKASRKNGDCATCEIQLKFCETHIRPFATPINRKLHRHSYYITFSIQVHTKNVHE